MSKTLINLISELVPTRAHAAVWAAVTLMALVVAFVPLFNLVGYESAALFGVVLGLCATGLTVYMVRSGRILPPLADERERSPTRDFGRLAVIHCAMIAGPALILTANGLRVTNCDWVAGFAFWGLIVVPAVLIGQTAGWVGVTLFARRRVAPWAVAFGLPVADAATLLAHLALQPPIVGHQWFLGYFGGSIYDEALAVPPSLIAYRVINLAAVVAVVAAIEVVFALVRGRRWQWTAALAVMAAVVCASGFAYRMEFGISIDRDYIAEELGGKVETDHFEIYYPKDSYHIEWIDEIVEEHEYRYAMLQEFFDTDPVAESGRKVRSFVYADRDSKGELMGGRDTMVAKLWLQEMHILWQGPNSRMLAHELAHIFTEPFGAGPLRLSMQNSVGVNMGLVEGAATAAEWPAGELTPHEASAAMRQLDIAPGIDRIVGAGGFWTEASGPAYVAMGSFVRFLIDEKGIDTFKEVYPGGDFEGGYGVSVDELIERWEEYVDGKELTTRQLVVAEERFDRPSIFGRKCARAIAEVRRQARSAASRGAFGQARQYYEQLLALDPDRPAAHREYARLLFDHDRHDEALEVIDNRPLASMTRVDEARFMELKGDILWSQGDAEEAVEAYSRALRAGARIERERSLRVKRHLAARDDDYGRAYLVDGGDGVGSMYTLVQWVQAAGADDPVAVYLLGRRLWQRRHYAEAIPYLQQSQQGLSAAVLDGEAALMLGQSLHFEGRFDEAQQAWEKLANSPVSYYADSAREWKRRTEWVRGNMR